MIPRRPPITRCERPIKLQHVYISSTPLAERLLDGCRWLWSGGVDAPSERVYPREDLDWIEETWDVDAAKLKGAVGYTLESLQEGQERLYNNVADVLNNGAERLIQPWQSRKQVIVMEECHRQNPLPKRPQNLQPQLSLDEELAVAVEDERSRL